MLVKTVVIKGIISTDTFGSFKSKRGLKDQSLICIFLLCILPRAEAFQGLLLLAADINVCAQIIWYGTYGLNLENISKLGENKTNKFFGKRFASIGKA